MKQKKIIIIIKGRKKKGKENPLKKRDHIKFRQRSLPFSSEYFVFLSLFRKCKALTDKTLVLCVVLYGCETGSHPLKRENSLKF